MRGPVARRMIRRGKSKTEWEIKGTIMTEQKIHGRQALPGNMCMTCSTTCLLQFKMRRNKESKIDSESQNRWVSAWTYLGHKKLENVSKAFDKMTALGDNIEKHGVIGLVENVF